MKMRQDLELKQTQKMIMTPELRQAINILRMSSVELCEYLQEEILNNPVLELEEETIENEEVVPAEKDRENKEDFPWEHDGEENVFEIDSYVNKGGEDASYTLENLPSQEETFLSDLLLQVRVLFDEEEQLMAEYLVECLDTNGYLRQDLLDIASQLNVPLAKIEEVLDVIHNFVEPAGIGARNLQECLLLQIKRKDKVPQLAQTLIMEYLPDIAAGKWQDIAEKLSIESEEIRETVNYISRLNPRPGNLSEFYANSDYIIPDVIVRKIGDKYVVIVPEEVSPYLRINPYYNQFLAGAGKAEDKEVSSFVKDKMNRAMWLIKSIEQRRLTLYRVAECIVEKQRGFLEKGVSHMEPLTLKEVAQELSLHESTVSRTVLNKYMQTPSGIYPLKYFFTSKIKSKKKGDSFSAASIKSYLQELLQNEPVENPYSDSMLTKILQEKGVDISRRTVTKYRKELLIPSSRARNS